MSKQYERWCEETTSFCEEFGIRNKEGWNALFTLLVKEHTKGMVESHQDDKGGFPSKIITKGA